MDTKKMILVLMVLVMSIAMAGVVNAAAGYHNATIGVASPAATTIYTTFYDVPVLQLNVTEYFGETDQIDNITAIKLAVTFGSANIGAINNFSFAFYRDNNSNAVVDANESILLEYTTYDQNSGVEKNFNIADINAFPENGSLSILIVAKTINPVAAGDTINITIENITFSTNSTSINQVRSKTLTVSGTAPSITAHNGAYNPGARNVNATHGVGATRSALIMQQVIFNNTAATADTVRQINITPSENMGENADIARVWFINDKDLDGTINTSDHVLKTSQTQFAGDTNAKSTFNITGSFVVPASSVASIIIAYGMDGSASDGEIHNQNITQVALGSAQAVTGQPAGNNLTIDIVSVEATILRLIDANSDGTLDQANITFDSVVRIIGPLQICNETFKIDSSGGEALLNGSTGSTVNNLTVVTYFSGNNSNSLILNLTNRKNNGLYDTGATAKAYVLNPNASCGNITDLAGNGLSWGILTALSSDTALPVLVNVSTHDADQSGKVDAYNLTFSESIWDNAVGGFAAHTVSANVSGTNFTISGRSSLKINFSRDTANNTAILLYFTEASTYDSSTTTAIALAASAVTDTTGNAIAAATVTAVDKARPIPINASFLDDDSDGDVDTIKLTVSENLNDNSFDNVSLIDLVGGYAIVTNKTNSTVISETNTANDTIVYLGVVEEGTTNNTGVIFNITAANTGMFDDRAAVPNEMAAVSATTFNEFDGAHPVVTTISNPTSQTGWLRTLTGPIVILFSEPVNATYTAARTNVTGVTTTVTNDTSQTDITVNLTLASLTDGTNHTIDITTRDAALNNLTIKWGIKADVTMPYLLYAYFNDSAYAYNGKDVAASDELVLIFSEPMREAGTADASIFFLVNGSEVRALAGAGNEVQVHSSYKEQARVLVAAADDLVVRGIYNASFNPDGINVTNGSTSNTITDLAGNPVDSVRAGVRDIMDNVINVTANTWTPISLPYGINSTAFSAETSGKSSSMYIYNSSWVAVTASQLVPYSAYLLRINESVKIYTQSVSRNTGTPTASATDTKVYEGWNLIGVDGYLDNTATNATSNGEWLASLGLIDNNKVSTIINANDLDTSINPGSLSAGDIYPYAAYWISVGDLTDGKATFTGYGRW